MIRFFCMTGIVFGLCVVSPASAQILGPIHPEKGRVVFGGEGYYTRFELEEKNAPNDLAQFEEFFVGGSVKFSPTDWLELTGRFGSASADIQDQSDLSGNARFDFDGGARFAWGGDVGIVPVRQRFWNIALRGGYFAHGDHNGEGPHAALEIDFQKVYGAVQLQAFHTKDKRLSTYIGARFSDIDVDFNSPGGSILAGRGYENESNYGIYGGLSFDFTENWRGVIDGRGGDEDAIGLSLGYGW